MKKRMDIQMGTCLIALGVPTMSILLTMAKWSLA
jgi:hypothetical protein